MTVNKQADIKTAMIFAAGEGRRMRSLTLNTPKPLLKIGEFSLLEHQVRALLGAGIRRFVINAAYLAEHIVEALKGFDWRGAEYLVSIEDKALETGGGLLHALPLLGSEPFLLINSDLWTDFNYVTLLDSPLASRTLAHLVLVANPDHNSAGDFVLSAEGQVHSRESLLETPLKNAGQALTFSGISIIRPELISHYSAEQEVFPLRDPLLQAIGLGLVTGEYFGGGWSDVGTPERLAEARQLYT